ncbi:MAG: YjjG family noncanonical pyrimidine nucleotidase [Oscillospiraceae bacterium]
MYTHILLDLDGTIFDFDYAQKKAFFKTFEFFGIPTDESMFAIYKRINNDMWRKLEQGIITREELVLKRFDELFLMFNIKCNTDRINSYYLKELTANTKLFPEVLEALKFLCKKYTLAAVTNGAYETQREKLAVTDTGKFFDKVFISEEEGTQKPDKRFFDKVLAHYESTPKEKFLMVGDSLTADVCGARNACLDCAWINRKNSEACEFSPKYIFKDMGELLEIL